MTDLPAEALAAATEAVENLELPGGVHFNYATNARIASTVLVAAAPHIRAAERQRIIAATSADEDTQLGLYRLAAADGALRERDRTAQLASLTEEILATFHESGDGQRARVGQVQVRRWRARLEEALR